MFKDSEISTNAKRLNENKLDEVNKEKLFKNIEKLYTNYITFDKSISSECIINSFSWRYSQDIIDLIKDALDNIKDDTKNKIENISFEPFEEIIIGYCERIFPQTEGNINLDF